MNLLTPPITFKFITYHSQMSQQYKHEKKNLRNTINSFISPSHDRRFTIAIYYKSTKLRQLFIKNNLHQDTSNSYVAYQYTCPMDGCNPSQIYIGYTYNHFPKAENDSTHTNRSHIRTQQKTVHQHRINTAKMLNTAKYFTLIRQGDIDHGTHLSTINSDGDTRIFHVFWLQICNTAAPLFFLCLYKDWTVLHRIYWLCFEFIAIIYFINRFFVFVFHIIYSFFIFLPLTVVINVHYM